MAELQIGGQAMTDPKEIKRMRRRCSGFDYPNGRRPISQEVGFSGVHCKRKSWLRDWAGWKWCFRHWFYHWRAAEGKKRKWWELRKTEIF